MRESVTYISGAARREEAQARLSALLNPEGTRTPAQMAQRLAKLREPHSDTTLMQRIELAYLASVAAKPCTNIGGPRYVEVVVISGSPALRCAAQPVSDPSLDGTVYDTTERDDSLRRKRSILTPLTSIEATTKPALRSKRTKKV